MEVWQGKELRTDFADLWQTQDLAVFLKRAEVCLGGIKETAWRVDISEGEQIEPAPNDQIYCIIK